MVSTGNREVDYLLTLINCTLKQEIAPQPEQVDMSKLLRLANRQQVYSVVLPRLEEIGTLSAEEAENWKNYQLSDLKKTIIVDNERNLICADLEKHGIDYMFLKGLVIRNYYPKTSMRQMSDNDILYDSSRQADLHKIMKAHGFYVDGVSDPSDDFKKPPCTIEFHRELFHKSIHYNLYLNPWERAERINGSHQFQINKEDNYIHAVMHMYKHYITEGCGIRFLNDLYLLHKGENYDWSYINSKFEESGVTQFHSTALGLCEAVYGNKEPDDEETEMLNKLFESSVFGKAQTLKERVDSRGGKFRYILDRLFPAKIEMYRNYDKLYKAPYLLPFYYIKRIFEKGTNNREQVKKEINALKKTK